MEPSLTDVIRSQAVEIERLRWRRRKDARQSKNLRDRIKRIRRDTLNEVIGALVEEMLPAAASLIKERYQEELDESQTQTTTSTSPTT